MVFTETLGESSAMLLRCHERRQYCWKMVTSVVMRLPASVLGILCPASAKILIIGSKNLERSVTKVHRTMFDVLAPLITGCIQFLLRKRQFKLLLLPLP